MKIAITTLLSIVLYTSTLFAYSYIQVVDPRNGGFWTQGTIKKATVIISPQGDYALYDLELELGVGKLSNSKSYDSLEITCNFSLPAGSYVTAASLLIGTEWVQANVLPRPEAHAIYEGFVKRRVDPLIVYKNYDDTYVLKIFPISPTNTRTMRLSYAMPLLSTNGFQSADVVLDLIKASQEPVDVSVLIKKTDDFPSPTIGGIACKDSQNKPGYVEATISNTNTSPTIVSSQKTKPIQFSSSTSNSEITYSLSCKPQELFDLHDFKKYVFIIDNDPQSIEDSIYSYRYSNNTYIKEFSKTRTIYPVANDDLWNEFNQILELADSGDSCKVFLKNNGIYVSNWIAITPENIQKLIQILKANDDTYKANLKELLLAAKTDIELDGVIPFLITNNKQMMYKPSSEIQKEARSIAFELNVSKSIYVWDITLLNTKSVAYYFNNNFVSELYNLLFHSSQRNYYYSLYSLSDLHKNFSLIRTNELSKVLLFSVTSRSNTGIVFDKYISNTDYMLPGTVYTELGKITEGTKLYTDISFLYKGKRYAASYEFDISDKQNTLLENAWAVKMVDKLNSLYINEAYEEAEKISTNKGILTQNTAMLAIEPGAEITPCYTCPDWNNTRLMLEDRMVVSNNIALATAYMPFEWYNQGYLTESYDAGFNDGITYIEQSIEKNNTELYDNGYAAGYADGIFNCNMGVKEKSAIEAYPTEFTTELQVIVYSNKPQIVEVYTANGIFIESFTITKVVKLQHVNSVLFSMPSGTYVLKTTINGEVSYAKVFKK